MLQDPIFFNTRTELGGVCHSKAVEEELESFQTLISSHPQYTTGNLAIRHPRRVTYCHSEFRISCFVMLSRQTDPVFGKVMDILVLPDNTVYFYVLVYITDYFDSHYHAYRIHNSADVYNYVTVQCLAKPFLFHAYKSFHRTNHFLYIISKYGIMSL